MEIQKTLGRTLQRVISDRRVKTKPRRMSCFLIGIP